MRSTHPILLATFVFLLTAPGFSQEKTAFQTAQPWKPELDIRSDISIVYGVNDSFPTRVNSWRERGYGIHMMTGVAWGEYRDYIEGEFDGVNHLDEGQVQRDGSMIMHHPGVPYMVPSEYFIAYLKEKIRRAIDEGVQAIHLEEPEFWNHAGYSEGFKREWQEYYNEPWQAQHESPDATYRSAKLKYHLYFRALDELFTYAKQYAQSKGTTVQCYVPTHTLINYSAWGITSPESNLAALEHMDGYIAQVWTGTARTPVIYRGIEKERTFENAWLEYASMVAMTRPTGKRVYFLTDPIEDRPTYFWSDYKWNYEATFVAMLLHPEANYFEVMPWPNRIFNGTYPTEGSDERVRIPPDYAAQVLIMVNALNDIPEADAALSGDQGVGVLISDTMMFQRFPTHDGYEDPRLSNLYGMALPFIKQGIPIRFVTMENLYHPNSLDDIDTLVMSYANMKPPSAQVHEKLAAWVKSGKQLVYLGRDNDPFQTVREWWNEDGMDYEAPSQHLFSLLDLTTQKTPSESFERFPAGDGHVVQVGLDPKEIAISEDPFDLVGLVLDEPVVGDASYSSHVFHLQRGAYDIVAVLDESVSSEPYIIEGPVVDLFDPTLPVLESKTLHPNERGLVYSLARDTNESPHVIAASSRASGEQVGETGYSWVMKGPERVPGIALVRLPKAPSAVHRNGNVHEYEWDEATQTLRLHYENQPDGQAFTVTW